MLLFDLIVYSPQPHRNHPLYEIICNTIDDQWLLVDDNDDDHFAVCLTAVN